MEGIDQLAAAFGAGEAVAELTASAMNGNTKFEDALAARLGLIKPTLQRTTPTQQEVLDELLIEPTYDRAAFSGVA